jgi:bifunctional non-homologous end joining protein LigD
LCVSPADPLSTDKDISPQTGFPAWVKPQRSQPVKIAPDRPEWPHEIELDGYRMIARIDHGDVRLLSGTGIDWTAKYPTVAGVRPRPKRRTGPIALPIEADGFPAGTSTLAGCVRQGGRGKSYRRQI